MATLRAQTRQKSTVQSSVPASYYRGGTSRGIMFHTPDLPASSKSRASLFLQAIGAPDPHGRQLNGMGAGVSSLSKICIIGTDDLPTDIDVTYTFIGIGIERDEVDYAGNCGNMASAVGPYAYNNRLLHAQEKADPGLYEREGEVTVSFVNTNTNTVIRGKFRVEGGQARVDDETSIDGVSGPGTGVMLDFIRPGGSKTGKLLPTGKVTERLAGYDVSCVDSANPCVFVRAKDLGVEPTILPDRLLEDHATRATLEKIRTEAAVAMGLIKAGEEPPRVIPKIALVSPTQDQTTLSGKVNSASELDLIIRFISDAQPHRASPLTGTLCTATAAKIAGSVVNECLSERLALENYVTIGHPSGKIQVDAQMDENGDVESARVLRTTRRLFEGKVFWNDHGEA
ncbi:DUF453 domain protein [Microthyrium microscopicum]|uniref:DUF453 domain protein n=1 Tax=Microthyrium microscopicum TaxID=703497 RepID=A0A6A6UC64_9PEZI|nr:DUF453 domain protein [Microthyrium microscopicum]